MLVISAHPDDAEFGVAGTVANWNRAGKKVVYVVCTRGEKGTTDRHLNLEQLATVGEKEQTAAADIRLGVAAVDFLGLPDQGLEDTPAFREQIVRVIRRYRPQTVVTSDPYRRYVWHRDHRIAGQVVLDAVFPYARDHLAYPEMLAEGLDTGIKCRNCSSGPQRTSTIAPTSPPPSHSNWPHCAAMRVR